MLKFVILISLSLHLYACTTTEDCQFNGICSNGLCQCDPGWTGSQCGVLNFVPAPLNAGFRQNDSYSWCGTILPDDKTPDLYHLYSSEMGDHCNLNVWRSDSQIVHATSQGSAVGPYKRVELSVAPEAHNPQAIRAPDGTYLLFDSYGGPNACPAKTDPATCSSISFCPCRGPGTGNFTFHTASSPAGPWSEHTVTLNYPCYSCNLTPAPFFHKNGTLFLMFHCDPDNTHNVCDLTMVRAENWKGPYSSVNNGAKVWDSLQSPGHPEDPFLWIDSRGIWHVLLHNGPNGLHIYSQTGLNFTVANKNSGPYPYTTNITTVNGVMAVNRRERPWMLFNSKGYPAVFVSSVEPQSGPDYTHVQALNS